MSARITTPTIDGLTLPGLEVCIRFQHGAGWFSIIRNHDTGHEYGRGKPLPTLEAAARLAAESLEAAK